jgi:uncharacterized membrane protein YjgN (DUF898 family)
MHGTKYCLRFVSNIVAMKSNTSNQHLSIVKVLENMLLLALVTFLLGMASTCITRVQHRGSAIEISHPAKETAHALRSYFIEPYTYAWKKMLPAAHSILSKFELGLHTPDFLKALPSTASELTALYFHD